MPDYGHDLLFGVFVTPRADRVHAVVALAELADRVGLDLLALQDHPYQPSYADTWTLLSVIAARTERIRVLPNVANLPLRPPAVLAKSVATLDLVSGGRVELGLGSGGFREAAEGLGVAPLSAGEAVDALEEAVGVIRALWTPGPKVTVEGRHHHLKNAAPGPFPAHDVGIWLGAYKPRMLDLTGRLADGWLPSSPYAAPEALAAMNLAIDTAAEAVGRLPSAVRRVYNVVGSFSGDGFLQGPPDVWVEQLAGLALDEGMSGFIMMSDDGRDIERFAHEVVPGVRDLVAAERSGLALRDVQVPDVPRVEVTSSVPASLGVTPTPDDGTRLSRRTVWDESLRPRGPVPADDAVYTAAQRSNGQHLVDIHDHLRSELAQVRDLIRQVAAGQVGVGEARSTISTMTLRQNNWTLGTYCESYCRVVTMHHTLEDHGLFPHLRASDARLVPVVDRLAEEHVAIHDVLERVDAALVHLVSHPTAIADVQDAVDLLTDTLLSHLSYEEHELVEPLARHGSG